MKRSHLCLRALSPNPSPMAVNYPLNGRQSHAGACKIRRGMQPLEHAEQLPVRHVEAGPVVAHEIDRVALLWRRPNSIFGCCRLPVNFHALPSRFSSTARSSGGSPRPASTSSTTHSTSRFGSHFRNSATTAFARALRSTCFGVHLLRVSERQLTGRRSAVPSAGRPPGCAAGG